MKVSSLAIVGGLIAFGFLALAAVLWVQPGSESTQRLGLFFGVTSVVITGLVSMLRADQAQKQTNGSLDQRVRDAVAAALASRRSSDPPSDPSGGAG